MCVKHSAIVEYLNLLEQKKLQTKRYLAGLKSKSIKADQKNIICHSLAVQQEAWIEVCL